MSTPTYSALPPIIPYTAFPQPITALSFDPVSDTLWTGNNAGTVAAYYSAHGLRGVSFKVGGSLAVKKLVADESVVKACTVSGEGVGAWSKGGVNKWYYRTPLSVTTFSHTTQSSLLAAATPTPELVLLNALTGTPTRTTSLTSVANQLHFSSSSVLLSGGSDGFLRLYDPRTGMRREAGSEHSVRAHQSEIQGLTSSGHVAYTIGWGLRQSRPVPDQLVKLYDLRTMRSLPPLQFAMGPAFISLLPRRSNSLVVSSNQGHVNIFDTLNPASVEFYQVDTAAYISSAAVSPTGAFMAFGDADGAVHLLSCADASVPLNGFEGQPVEWADAPEPLPEISWEDDQTPLNSVGLPYYNQMLLSSWPAHLAKGRPSRPPPKIPESILRVAKMSDGIMYAPLPRELRGMRNVVQDREEEKGRFRSTASKKTARERERDSLDENDSTKSVTADGVPSRYRRVEIEYSRFGVEDFDFGFYNRTSYSGLETHILNSYTNALLQTLFYTPPLRSLAKSHIATDCAREWCLLCELGFVCRMLEDAGGRNCQSSNFCRTAGGLAMAANALELVDYGTGSGPGMDYGDMIQAFHRFLVDHLAIEGNNAPHNPTLISPALTMAAPPPPSPHDEPSASPAPSPITQLLGLGGHTVSTCGQCGYRSSRPAAAHILDLIYPRVSPSTTTATTPPPTLAQILETSLAREITHRSACGVCRSNGAMHTSRREITDEELPPVLAVNVNAGGEDAAEVWADRGRGKGFLPLGGRVTIRGTSTSTTGQQGEEGEGVEYELRAMVVKIAPAPGRTPHLISFARVSQSTQPDDWYLFNDFLVQPVSESEVFSFPGAAAQGGHRWKVPAVMYLERVDCVGRVDYGVLEGRGKGVEGDVMGILGRDTNIAANRDPALIQHVPLAPSERPTPGTVIAIDAEFVQMQAEEAEFRSDGTRTVLRPARLGLARVSVLRENGTAFIDDHVQTSEAVVDYLTEYSGINFGDLDPTVSRFTLTPLKVVYKKLRALVDCGCIFIGHGLSKDFRIINIFVPPDQVIDTVDVYFIRARQRRLSLRFLAWTVLHERIQARAHTHDSIEDARTALRLWKAFQDLEEEGPGAFDSRLEEVYKEGRELGWKPPPDPDAEPVPPATVPTAPTAPSPFGGLLPAFGAPVPQGPGLFGQSVQMVGGPLQMAGPMMGLGLPAFFSPPPAAPSSRQGGRGRWGQ
ncbi:hypothetical protein PENSPDRAFT_577089 [Peniophora sp. CONT]|nr:hypothetical protein PENSPDRAFT_577089 [Peniophora sp. CONT]